MAIKYLSYTYYKMLCHWQRIWSITTILPRPIPTTVSAIFMVAYLSRKSKKMINSHVILPDFKVQGHSVMLPSTLDTEIIYLPLV